MMLSRSVALLTSRLARANEAEFSVLEALSGISGSISLVCWIVLLVCEGGVEIRVVAPTDTAQLPQLIENYKNGSADALSLAFLITWFVGDLANLIGMRTSRLWWRDVPLLCSCGPPVGGIHRRRASNLRQLRCVMMERPASFFHSVAYTPT
jgi:hypothetical protein